MLFSSPRNNMDAHVSLMDSTTCRTVLGPTESGQEGVAQCLAAQRGAYYAEVPALENLLHHEVVEEFPWSAQTDDIADEPFIVLHTSGSTGLPKAVEITHGLIATIDAQKDLADIDGRNVTASQWANRSVYTALPPFHSAGINFFSFSIFQATQLVFGPSDSPPSLSAVERMLDLEIADAGVMAPSLLTEVAQDPVILEKISRWSSVTFGGGPLPQQAGDALWHRTKVLQILGSTETFNVPELVPRTIDEWPYHHFHPSLNIQFRPLSESLHELVFVRDDDVRQHQGAFWTFPDRQEYSMKDMYELHPHKANCWKYKGRLDDIIVLSNGEKFNPTSAEQAISQCQTVKDALVVGAEKEQPAVLVEPAPVPDVDPEDRQESVQQAIVQANDVLPAHAQIHSSHVRVLDSSEAFLRSSKGEIRRAPTVNHLSDVIASIYDSAEQSSTCTSELQFRSENTLLDSLVALLSTDFLGGRRLKEDENIFQCGMDSLQVIKLLRHVKASLRSQGSDTGLQLTPRIVYEYPTSRGLANALFTLLHRGDRPGDSKSEARSHSGMAEMKERLETLTGRLDDLPKQGQRKVEPCRIVVVLTGSTGSLGAFILNELIRNQNVREIVCLNRSGSGAQKQMASNKSRGLSTDFHKVTFLEANLDKPRLGLKHDVYARLQSEASHIVHNAWAVDFNLPLASFDPQLEICWSLIELAHGARNRVSMNFLSSVGAANAWPEQYKGSVPEEVLSDLRLSEAMGYAQSKQLAELLFAQASKDSDIPTRICRLGQIAGPVKSYRGQWNPQEWFPSIMLSCRALGKIPSSLGSMDCMDWIPVDVLGKMLVDTILPGDGTASSNFSSSVNGSHEETKCLHFVNPHKVYWSDMVHSLIGRSNPALCLVSYEQWLHDLTAAADQHDDVIAEIPAVKLLPFFISIGEPGAERPFFSTEVAQAMCSELRELPPVSSEWLRHWATQWQIEDLLPARPASSAALACVQGRRLSSSRL